MNSSAKAVIIAISMHVAVVQAACGGYTPYLVAGSTLTISSTLGYYWLRNAFLDTPIPTKCTVRAAENDLCQQEQTFLKQRDAITRRATHALLAIPDTGKRVPRIALSFSGGGCRAMIASLGVLQGASEVGVLDAITDITAVSGSTWAITSWIASGLDITRFIKQQRTRLSKGLLELDETLVDGLLEIIKTKIIYGQQISAMDIYGPLLANVLLADIGDERITATLSTTHSAVANGTYPLPLYSAINANTQPYDWLECTPFEIGSPSMQVYASTPCYGSTFNNGTAKTIAPEQTLGYMMATFGSAFEVSIKDFIIRVLLPLIKKAKKQSLPSEVVALLQDLVDENRLLPSELPNFAYNMQSSPLKKDKTLTLVDAGIDYNVPIRALLNPQRAIDIIIMIDASEDIAGAPELKLAEAYAKKHNLPFPTIDYRGIETKLISIFYDADNPNIPALVYIPLIKNAAYSQTFDPTTCMSSGYCGTFNFTYKPEQFDELAGLTAYTLKESLQQIKDLIKTVMEKKQ